MMRIKPLTSLIIEPTNTCNLRCTFCFVTDGMNREEGFMDFELFKKVIDDCPNLEHLCMHNWGEPLLHKEIFKMFDYAHKAGIKFIVMNTNGTLLSDQMIGKIVDSPLSIIRFSIDGSAETFKRVRGVELEKIEKNIIKLKNEKEKKRPDLIMGTVFTVEEDTLEDVDPYLNHWESIMDQVRTQPKLIQSPRGEPCPEPFGKDYGKLVVLWDGTVIPCCVDYNATLKLGSAVHENVQDLWTGREIERLRIQHEKGQYPAVCINCNECMTPKTKKRFFFEELVS
jgi:sulfatase maturation enzyme AslB (radical SAM superfamily)